MPIESSMASRLLRSAPLNLAVSLAAQGLFNLNAVGQILPGGGKCHSGLRQPGSDAHDDQICVGRDLIEGDISYTT